LAAVVRAGTIPGSVLGGGIGRGLCVAAQPPGKGLQFAGVGLDGDPRSDLEPYLSAQTTWGSDAHFGSPAMRTGVPVHPHAQQRLAAVPPGRPWQTGHEGAVGSDPAVRGPATGSGAGVFAHPCPRPFRVAPEPAIPTREGEYERQFDAAEHPVPRPEGRSYLFLRCSTPHPGGVRSGDAHRGRVPIRLQRISRMNGNGR